MRLVESLRNKIKKYRIQDNNAILKKIKKITNLAKEVDMQYCHQDLDCEFFASDSNDYQEDSWCCYCGPINEYYIDILHDIRIELKSLKLLLKSE